MVGVLGQTTSMASLKSPIAKSNWHIKANTQASVEARLKAIGECLILSGAELHTEDQGSWAAVHVAAKSYSLGTIRWMLSVN